MATAKTTVKKVMKPNSRPQIKRDVVEALCRKYGLTEKVGVIGIRGYYLDSMGAKGKNDRGIYDDCILIITPEAFVTFNANVDPSGYRKGVGTGSKKGMASLKAGILYRAHGIGLHRGKYTALVQTKGKVTVIRDGLSGDYEETGRFGINIHKGGIGTTSSLGCQTIHPDQWPSFIAIVKEQMARYKMSTMPYLLLDNREIVGG